MNNQQQIVNALPIPQHYPQFVFQENIHRQMGFPMNVAPVPYHYPAQPMPIVNAMHQIQIMQNQNQNLRQPNFPRPVPRINTGCQNRFAKTVQVQHPNAFPIYGASDFEAAESIYREISKLIPDINKQWVMQRAGHGVDILVNYIFDNYDRVPMEPKHAEQDHNLDASMAYENDENEQLISTAEEEKTAIIADALKRYILRLNNIRGNTRRSKIMDFLKFKYGNVKVETLQSLRLGDPRIVFSLCTLMNMKKLSRKMAAELGVEYLWKKSTPWLHQRPRKIYEEIILDKEYQKAFNEVQKVIESAANNIPLYMCCVCFDEFSIKRVISCGGSETTMINEETPDAHYVCHDCMRQHAVALCSDGKLADGGEGLCCLDPSCDKVIPWARVKVLLSRDVRHRLGKRIDNEALLNLDGLERCKRCSFAAVFDVPIEVNKVFDCAKCHAQFCRNCKYNWQDHIGKRCDEMKKVEDEKERQRKKLEEELAMAVLRTCHRCKLVFSKDDGCNKMTCRCGATQCYCCRKADINYDHFCQHVRDPRQPGCPENCNGCLLWASQDDVNKKAIQEVRERAATNRGMHEFIKRL